MVNGKHFSQSKPPPESELFHDYITGIGNSQRFRLIFISSELADIKELATTSGSFHTTKGEVSPTKDAG